MNKIMNVLEHFLIKLTSKEMSIEKSMTIGFLLLCVISYIRYIIWAVTLVITDTMSVADLVVVVLGAFPPFGVIYGFTLLTGIFGG